MERTNNENPNDPGRIAGHFFFKFSWLHSSQKTLSLTIEMGWTTCCFSSIKEFMLLLPLQALGLYCSERRTGIQREKKIHLFFWNAYKIKSFGQVAMCHIVCFEYITFATVLTRLNIVLMCSGFTRRKWRKRRQWPASLLPAEESCWALPISLGK